MKVRDVMTSDVVTASPDTTLEEVATMMKEEDTGVIPVLDDDDQLVGVVTDRDIVVRCVAQGSNPSETTVEEAITEDLQTVEPDTDVREAARLMGEKQIRRLPVVENGEFVGMLSLGDIAVKSEDEQVAGEALEEVSAGVKGSQRQQPATAGRKQPAASGRKQPAAGGRKQSGSARQQGISSRRADQEKGRQQRVVPMQGKAARSGRQRSGRKAG